MFSSGCRVAAGIHFDSTNTELFDTQCVRVKSTFMGSARSPALRSAGLAPAVRAAQSACDVPAVLCLRVSVSGGIGDGHITPAGLELSQGDAR